MTREGKVGLTVWVDPKLRDDVKRVALDKGCTAEVLLTETIQQMVSKHMKGRR